jgi:protein-disulfide isomerase
MTIEAQTPPQPRKRQIAAAALVVLVAAAGAGILARTVKAYIDRSVAGAVAARLTDEWVDGRARSAALDVIKDSPQAVAESLNHYIVQQQKAVLAKEDDGYRVVPEMADASGLPVLGSSDAKLTIVYFFDANCPYCKQMDPILRPYLAPGSNVRVIYREIPILGPGSERAARYASALWSIDPAHYVAFHAALMSNKGHVDDAAIDRIATAALGEETARKVALAVMVDDDSVSGPIRRNLDLAHRAGIKGTPFFSIGGKKVFKGAASRDEFAEAVAKALAGEP